MLPMVSGANDKKSSAQMESVMEIHRTRIERRNGKLEIMSTAPILPTVYAPQNPEVRKSAISSPATPVLTAYENINPPTLTFVVVESQFEINLGARKRRGSIPQVPNIQRETRQPIE